MLWDKKPKRTSKIAQQVRAMATRSYSLSLWNPPSRRSKLTPSSCPLLTALSQGMCTLTYTLCTNTINKWHFEKEVKKQKLIKRTSMWTCNSILITCFFLNTRWREKLANPSKLGLALIFQQREPDNCLHMIRITIPLRYFDTQFVAQN